MEGESLGNLALCCGVCQVDQGYTHRGKWGTVYLWPVSMRHCTYTWSHGVPPNSELIEYVSVHSFEDLLKSWSWISVLKSSSGQYLSPTLLTRQWWLNPRCLCFVSSAVCAWIPLKMEKPPPYQDPQQVMVAVLMHGPLSVSVVDSFQYSQSIDGFHSILHHRNWRAKVSCDVDINQSAGNMVM